MISEEVLDKKRNNDETEKMEGEKSFTLFTRRQCDNERIATDGFVGEYLLHVESERGFRGGRFAEIRS